MFKTHNFVYLSISLYIQTKKQDFNDVSTNLELLGVY